MNRRKQITIPNINSDTSDDDDDVCVVDNSKRKKSEGRLSTGCLNPTCSSNLIPSDNVPVFVRTYYRVKRRKNVKVCTDCLNEAMTYYFELGTILESNGEIANGPCPPHNDVVNIDSDIEDLSSDFDDDPLDEENMKLVQENLVEIFTDVVEKYNLDSHLDKAVKTIKGAVNSLIDTHEEHDRQLNDIQNEVDNIRNKIYAPFIPIYRHEPVVEFVDDYVAKHTNPNNLFPIPIEDEMDNELEVVDILENDNNKAPGI